MYGNNDLERPSLEAAASEYGLEIVDPPLHFVSAGRRVLVVHDPKGLDREAPDATDVALHGHEHRQVIERREGALVFNPGECAGHMPGLNQIGVLDLARLETEILRF